MALHATHVLLERQALEQEHVPLHLRVFAGDEEVNRFRIDLDLVRFNYDVKAEILKYTTETVDDANLATAIQNGIETTCDEAYDAFKKMEWCRLPKQIDACTKIATGTYNFVTADPWTRATTIKGWADSIGLG